MLCDKCHEREAHIQVTSVINGVSETKHLCEQCAAAAFPNIRPNHVNPDTVNEWSKAIFKLISDSITKSDSGNAQKENPEQIKGITCPNCKKTYGEFLEDGIFGCSGCYEVFNPFLQNLVKGLQGAENHVAKRNVRMVSKEDREALKAAEKLCADSKPKRNRLEELTAKMNLAAEREDYEKAAYYRDEIRKLKEEGGNHG